MFSRAEHFFFTACSVALCEYGTCVFRLYCFSVSILPFASRSHGRLVAAASNKLGSHIVQGGSGCCWWEVGGDGGEIDATLLWCDLERSPNLRYDLSRTDFRPTCGFNHPPRAPCVLRVPLRPVSMRGPTEVDGGGPAVSDAQ